MIHAVEVQLWEKEELLRKEDQLTTMMLPPTKRIRCVLSPYEKTIEVRCVDHGNLECVNEVWELVYNYVTACAHVQQSVLRLQVSVEVIIYS